MITPLASQIRWLGHDGFAVTGAGQTIVFDVMILER